MKEVKKKLLLFAVFATFFASAPFVGLYVYDPIQVFHKHWHQDDMRLHGNMRLQAAGVVNNYDFDGLILSTSMMKGTSSKLASQLLGGDFVNLSADGSTIFERSIILKYALKKNKSINRVIFSFDTGLDIHNLHSLKKYPLKNYGVLYDDSYFNDFKVYWNEQKLYCMFKWSDSSDCIGSKRGLQREEKWFDSISQSNKKISGLDNWLTEKGRGKAVNSRLKRHLKLKRKPVDSSKDPKWKAIVHESFIPIVDQNKDTQFEIVFPPYSRFLTSIWKKKNIEKYTDYKAVIEDIVSQAETRDNLTVHNFDNFDYVADLNNYRDMRHYNVDMNIKMLESISKKSNTLDAGSLQKHFENFDILNESYNHESELERILNTYNVTK